MANIGVETAQHVQLNYKPAAVSDRIIAYLLDGVVLAVYWFFLITIASIGESGEVVEESGDANMWIGILIIMLPVMLYHLLMEVLWNGYTVGKWLVGIRVVKLDGTRPGLSNYLIWWLIRLFEITMTSGGLALITILVNGKGQRLGDIAAKTCVIKVRRKSKLSDTMLEEVEDDYEPEFPQVIELEEQDITIINEVLKSRKNYDYAAWLKMVSKTRQLIQEKMGVLNTNRSDTGFLEQVIKDYNAINGILD